MPFYRYRALNNHGEIYRGALNASTKGELFHRLKSRGHYLLNARAHYNFANFSLRIFSSALRQDLLVFCLHMEQMDRVGIPLLEALADMGHFYASPKLRTIVNDLYDDVKEGMMLSEAFGRYPHIFDCFFIQIIRMSEKTGHLYEGFEKLIGHLKWVEETQRKLFQALRYPAILSLIVTITFIVLLTTLVPQLMGFLLSLGISPPPLTMALIAVSDFLKEDALMLIIAAALILGGMLALKHLSFQAAALLSHLFLHLPFIGPLWKKILILRYIHAFSITLAAGIDILESLHLAENIVQNCYLKMKLRNIREQVTSGVSLSHAIEMSGVFTAGSSHMFKIGEQSGQLHKVLDTISYFLEAEINARIKTLIDLIEPGLILAIGGIMFWIIMAMFYPIYDHLSLVTI